jgi:hypothetical protein
MPHDPKDSDAIPEDGLSEYMDNLMSPEERADFDQRLNSDQELKAEYEGMENAREALRRLPDPQVPQGFLEGVHDRIKPRRRASDVGARTAERRMPYETTLSILLFVTLVVVYIVTFGGGTKDHLVPVDPRTYVSAPKLDTALNRLGDVVTKPLAHGLRYELVVGPEAYPKLLVLVTGEPRLTIKRHVELDDGRYRVDLFLRAPLTPSP